MSDGGWQNPSVSHICHLPFHIRAPFSSDLPGRRCPARTTGPLFRCGMTRSAGGVGCDRREDSACNMAPMTASRARYRVVALATTLAMVNYLDRVAIGTLAPGIRRDLGLSAVEMGWV